MTGRRGSSAYSDETILRMWMDRGAVCVPMVSSAWPGACPKEIREPLTTSEMRAHLYFQHGMWHLHRTLVKMAKMHHEAHTDPLWSYVPMPGEIVHVHVSGIVESEEWSW